MKRKLIAFFADTMFREFYILLGTSILDRYESTIKSRATM